ncbi:hypothetical protein [Methylococcus sp. EFPC2]|uniref:hypothetical protein n=1 Tax=Methylococcus sp. EFPC2 TaxID=2812648 RepID=UPI00196859C5|nr:hypothetical protein [Methylococcus sp. EFPC2]QSA98096.1 hypothetical protein JWZ97_04565 [Methylococcus sp. EFPC2]
MNNITKALLTVALTLGLLEGCAQSNPHPMDMTVAVQSAKTKTDHEALAAHYEQAAKEADAMVEEHQQILADFKKDPHDYPKSYLGGNFESHCQRLIDIYERAAAENREMAKMHRQMAAGAISRRGSGSER